MTQRLEGARESSGELQANPFLERQRQLRVVNREKGGCEMKINFGDVETREFEPLPVGKHLSKMTAADFVAESSRSGEPAVAWQFTVDGGEYDSRKGFLNTSLQPQSLWSTQRILLALGMTKEEVDALDWDTEAPDKIQEDLDGLLGVACYMTIGHEMFEGVKRQRVRRILSAEGVEGSGEAPF